jgi:hypothetical protein
MGSFDWEIQIIKVIVGENLFEMKPNVNNIVADTGTTSIVIY